MPLVPWCLTLFQPSVVHGDVLQQATCPLWFPRLPQRKQPSRIPISKRYGTGKLWMSFGRYLLLRESSAASVCGLDVLLCLTCTRTLGPKLSIREDLNGNQFCSRYITEASWTVPLPCSHAAPGLRPKPSLHRKAP